MHLKCYQCTSCGINPVFTGLSPTYGQVTYALLTRAPVSAPKGISLDLHVLGLSLAFILSQDQTLHCTSFILYSSSTILTSSSLKGIYALMYFVLPYTSHTFFKYAACLYHYFNQLSFVSRTGLQRYAFFLSFQIQIKNFCIFFGIIFLLSNRLSATR